MIIHNHRRYHRFISQIRSCLNVHSLCRCFENLCKRIGFDSNLFKGKIRLSLYGQIVEITLTSYEIRSTFAAKNLRRVHFVENMRVYFCPAVASIPGIFYVKYYFKLYIIFAFQNLIHKTRCKGKKKGYFFTSWFKFE